jgi:hypothetical protein
MEYRPTNARYRRGNLKDGQTLANACNNAKVIRDPKPKPKRRLQIIQFEIQHENNPTYLKGRTWLAPAFPWIITWSRQRGVMAAIKKSISSLLERDAHQDIDIPTAILSTAVR